MFKKTTLLVFTVLILFLVLTTTIVNASPPVQADGQEYIVQAGDWLSKLAEKYYDDPLAYLEIVAATNVKAGEDNSFAVITNPDVLETGQKLWIPAAEPLEFQTIAGDAATLEQFYLEAVEDAAIAELNEISTNLIAIVESNDRLVWRVEAGNKQVLVLTWTSWDGYDEQVGKEMTMTRQTWVTVVPELKDFCTSYNTTQSNLTLRLEQLLGLPPNNGKTRFVEIWVKPTDLFRPSPDPAITDQEAELSFPTSKYIAVSPDYVAWFNDLSSQSYGEGGYPWTRLGYTYDWGNPMSEIGLSEFVIDEGALVGIEGVTTTEDYCR